MITDSATAKTTIRKLYLQEKHALLPLPVLTLDVIQHSCNLQTVPRIFALF